ncbi:hypothetical protein E1265_21925 [Streptomyces sp. 8K308]|nr:hypothetical protein E1265_21925 [Streptomyces sp. 8K308]
MVATLALLLATLYIVFHVVSSSWRSVGDALGSFLSGTDNEVVGADYTPPTTARGQAEDLDALLTWNTGTRDTVAEAVQSLLACPDVPPDQLAEAKETFMEAADDRTTRLESLDALALDELADGDGLERALREAWGASAEADRAYARLADEASCDQALTASPHWAEAEEANERATAAKTEFVEAWSPIAEEYDLTVLSWDDV